MPSVIIALQLQRTEVDGRRHARCPLRDAGRPGCAGAEQAERRAATTSLGLDACQAVVVAVRADALEQLRQGTSWSARGAARATACAAGW